MTASCFENSSLCPLFSLRSLCSVFPICRPSPAIPLLQLFNFELLNAHRSTTIISAFLPAIHARAKPVRPLPP